MTHNITWSRESAAEVGSRPVFARWLHTRRDDRDAALRASLLVRRFTEAASRLGLADHTESCAGIPGLAVPKVQHVRFGDVDRLVVRMLAGQVPGDYRQVGANFAEALGVHYVRIARRSHGLIFVDLHRHDRLADAVPLPSAVDSADVHVLLGALDTGSDLHVRLSDLSHMIVQGSTRSGKSRFLYGFLSQIVDAKDVLICGSDVSAITLRPLRGTRHGHLIATGSASPKEHAELLEELVSIMDDRLARMPDDLDVFPCTEEDPYLVTVLEELPGLLRRAKATRKELPGRILDAYGRLLAEGAKAGFRLVLVAQRAEATIIGGYEREQCPLRISFSVSDPASVRMLHPAASDDLAAWHGSAPAGRALVTMPGLPVGRMRSPEMGSYAEYRTNVLSPLLDVPADAPA